MSRCLEYDDGAGLGGFERMSLQVSITRPEAEGCRLEGKEERVGLMWYTSISCRESTVQEIRMDDIHIPPWCMSARVHSDCGSPGPSGAASACIESIT